MESTLEARETIFAFVYIPRRVLVFYLVLSQRGFFVFLEYNILVCYQSQKTVHTADEIKHDPKVALDYVNIANTLACLYVDIEEFDKAEQLHKEVLELKQK